MSPDYEETFLPKKEFLDNPSDHVARYVYASKFAKDKFVLDFGCGHGYGTNYLAQVAKKIIGVDLNSNYIRYAKKRYQSRNLQYYISNQKETNLQKSSFDLIVCYEVIEHVENIHQVLQTIKSLLKPDGIFIVSTPNKKLSPQIHGKPVNPFHIKEHTKDEFQTLLLQYFNNVQIQGQHHRNATKPLVADYLRKANLWFKTPSFIRILIPQFIKNLLLNSVKLYELDTHSSYEDFCFERFEPDLSRVLIATCTQ